MTTAIKHAQHAHGAHLVGGGTARDVGDRVDNPIGQAKGRFPAESADARPAGGSPTLLMENPTGPRSGR
jgi:hypothetical protein